MQRIDIIHAIGFCSAFVPSLASAMDWPVRLTCTDTTAQLCKDGGSCVSPEMPKITKARWTFDLQAKSFDISEVFEGKLVPNFSGSIVHQHNRKQGADYGLLTILLDTDQMVTFSPKQLSARGSETLTFWGVMQFANPGGSTTIWATCSASGNGR